MIHITPDTELSVVCNGKLSVLPASWWLGRVGQKANLLDPICTQTNVLLDAYSMEPLSIRHGDPMELIEVETNFAPKSGTHITFCAPRGTRLRLYFGGEIVAQNHGALVGVQLLGVLNGYPIMLHVTVARTVVRKTYLCNTTSLSGALLAHPSTAKFAPTAYIERDLSIAKRYMPQRRYDDDPNRES